jgi:hypothetical protein
LLEPISQSIANAAEVTFPPAIAVVSLGIVGHRKLLRAHRPQRNLLALGAVAAIGFPVRWFALRETRDPSARDAGRSGQTAPAASAIAAEYLQPKEPPR